MTVVFGTHPAVVVVDGVGWKGVQAVSDWQGGIIVRWLFLTLQALFLFHSVSVAIFIA